jgi:hypothetical protein
MRHWFTEAPLIHEHGHQIDKIQPQLAIQSWKWGEQHCPHRSHLVTGYHCWLDWQKRSRKSTSLKQQEGSKAATCCDTCILTHQLPFKFDSMGLGNWGGPVAICGQQRGRSAPVPALRSAWWWLSTRQYPARTFRGNNMVTWNRDSSTKITQGCKWVWINTY